MTKQEIIDIACKAGLQQRLNNPNEWFMWTHELERFATLVAEKEREACAKVCEGRIGGAIQSNEWWNGFKSSMKQCASAIRARAIS